MAWYPRTAALSRRTGPPRRWAPGPEGFTTDGPGQHRPLPSPALVLRAPVLRAPVLRAGLPVRSSLPCATLRSSGRPPPGRPSPGRPRPATRPPGRPRWPAAGGGAGCAPPPLRSCARRRTPPGAAGRRYRARSTPTPGPGGPGRTTAGEGRRSDGRGPSRSGRQAMTPFPAAGPHDGPAGLGRHAMAKSVLLGPLAGVGLERPLGHPSPPVRGLLAQCETAPATVSDGAPRHGRAAPYDGTGRRPRPPTRPTIRGAGDPRLPARGGRSRCYRSRRVGDLRSRGRVADLSLPRVGR